MKTNLSRRIITSTIIIIIVSSPRAAAQPAPLPPTSYTYDHPIGITPAMIITFMSIVTIFFLMGCFTVFGRYCMDYSSGPGSLTRADAAVDGLDPTIVGSFPAFVYSEVKGLKIGKGALECAICISEFEDTDTLRLLPKCCHVFHQDCIDTWLRANVTCPVCRAMPVPRPGETNNFVLPVREPEDNTNSYHMAEDDIIIDIESSELASSSRQTTRLSVPPRSTSRRSRLFGMFKRSFTTGHVVAKPVRPDDAYTRFTLRLHGDVQSRLVSRSIGQSAPFPRVESKRNGYRNASVGPTYGRSLLNYERFEPVGRPDRWRFTRTLSNFSSISSGLSPSSMGKEINECNSSKILSRSVKSSFPFDEDESIKEDVNLGERSFDRLRFDSDHVQGRYYFFGT